MKKLIAIVAVAVTGFASFGQGYFSFTSNTRGAWDAFTTPSSPKLAADINVGFLWGTGTALISGVFNSIATNNTTGLTPSQLATAWTDITTDPNFKIANVSGVPVVTGTSAGGAWNYNSGGTFGVDNTSAGSVYTLIAFGWSNAYATPALAAAAGSPVGWSAPFSYTSVASIGTPLTMNASGLLPFGVTTVVPEPATIALAGLGGLALLALRRKK